MSNFTSIRSVRCLTAVCCNREPCRMAAIGLNGNGVKVEKRAAGLAVVCLNHGTSWQASLRKYRHLREMPSNIALSIQKNSPQGATVCAAYSAVCTCKSP